MFLIKFFHISLFFLYSFIMCMHKGSCQMNKISVSDLIDISPREKHLFNEGWKFKKNDADPASEKIFDYQKLSPWILPSANHYLKEKKHSRPNKDAPTEFYPYTLSSDKFDDSNWRTLDLPHDWGIEEGFIDTRPNKTGKLSWAGIGWYRKSFMLTEKDRNKQISLTVDGAMSYSQIYCNGRLVGGWPYGYTSFEVDLSPYVIIGQENIIAIRLNNIDDSSRWYPGGGIYRNVWLIKKEKLFISTASIHIPDDVDIYDEAVVNFELHTSNKFDTSKKFKASVTIFETNEQQELKTVSCQSSEEMLIKGDELHSSFLNFKIKNPQLWSIDHPKLYTAKISICSEDGIEDHMVMSFGVRSAKFLPGKGFYLNGNKLKFQGVCMHHDLGALGAAFYVRAAERQLEILKEMGVNAIRTAHNPPAPEFLDLCDQMGFLVIDEFSDTWTKAKAPNGYAALFEQWSEADLRSMIQRDHHHPSVIMWSTGNEIGEQWSPKLHHVSRRLSAISKDEDPTRPTTAGCDQPVAANNGFQKTIDIFGFNYKPHLYESFIRDNPHHSFYGSETASTVSSRGMYAFPVSEDQAEGQIGFHMSSYDLYAPKWASSPDVEFKGQDSYNQVCGEFVWTGFDYLGEPTPFNDDITILTNFHTEEEKNKAKAELDALSKQKIPSRSSYFGIVDLAGFKKDRFYIYQSRWRPDFPVAHILPHWNWPERIGKITPVHVYTNGDEAELFINGKSLGRRKMNPLQYRLRWDDVIYEPGEIRVVSYKDGKLWTEKSIETTDREHHIELSVDRHIIDNDGYDLAFVTAKIVDSKGRFVPNANQKLNFSLSGPAIIAATDNGDPTDMTSFTSHSRFSFNGLALAIIKSNRASKGNAKLTVENELLGKSDIHIQIGY